MITMILTKRNGNNELFYSWQDFHEYTFSPEDRENTESLVFTLTGTTYQEKKEALRELAIDAQRMDCGGLGWSEEADIYSFMETYGRRYGLLREFQENGIL